MAPTHKATGDSLLARVNFPLYSVEMLSNRHCIVAGGGGAAKTGVANGFEIYEIHHNGQRFVAEEIVRHETGADSIMNCSVSSPSAGGPVAYLATGQESNCQLFEIKSTVVSGAAAAEQRKGSNASITDTRNGAKNLRSRKPPAKNNAAPQQNDNVDNGNAVDGQRIVFDVKPLDSVQTDFQPKDPFQRVVRISPSGKTMATGGTDGHIRVWSFPRMRLLHDLAVHTREADDLSFSPDGKRLVSIAKDGVALITDVDSGAELVRLQWTPPEGTRYMFKRCRFAVAEGKTAMTTNSTAAGATSKFRLFTISNPFGRTGSKQKGFLQQWDADRGRLTGIVDIDESLSALAVRDDGRFVAVGTMFTGSVSIYVAFSLQRVLNVSHAHSMFVTGLEFLPLTGHGPDISSDAEAAVLSISVDNKVCIHSLKPRHMIPLWLAALIIALILFVTFCLCSIIGL